MMVVLLSFLSAGGLTMVVLLSFFSAGGFTVVVFLLACYQKGYAAEQADIFFHTHTSYFGRWVCRLGSQIIDEQRNSGV